MATCVFVRPTLGWWTRNDQPTQQVAHGRYDHHVPAAELLPTAAMPLSGK